MLPAGKNEFLGFGFVDLLASFFDQYFFLLFDLLDDFPAVLQFCIQFNIAGSTPGKITAVPEPSAFALIGLVGGLTAVGNWYRKRRTAAKAAE